MSDGELRLWKSHQRPAQDVAVHEGEEWVMGWTPPNGIDVPKWWC